MEQDTTNSNSNSFLYGGGEMGRLTREFDWSETLIGKPDSWPQSLRVIVGLILRSKFPMFLWWGTELIQFYNDAYRHILGSEGKHPKALGGKAVDSWPEIWSVIKPLIESVIETGESVWREDQLIPIYRNGKIEDVYWTFSYVVVVDDNGKNAGVLVTCIEKNENIGNKQLLTKLDKQLYFAMEASELATWELDPNTHKFTASRRLRDWFGLPLEGDFPFTDAVAAVPEKDQKLISEAIATAMSWESGGKYEIEHRVINLQTGKERIVRAVGLTTFDENKKPLHFNGTIQDITESFLAKQRIEESENKLRGIIASAPAGIGVFVGRDLIIQNANQTFIDIVGKGPHIEGLPLREAMPELLSEGQPFLKILEDIFDTGIPFSSPASLVKIVQNDILRDNYYNISYTPIYNSEGEIYAILDIAIDVTEQIKAQQQLQEAEVSMRGAVELAQLGTWSIDAKTNALIYSDRLIRWFGFDPAAQPYDEVIPILQDGDQERVASAVAWALNPQSDGVYDEIYTVINPTTGKKTILHAQGKVIYDQDGIPIRMNGTAQDITIQRELQLALENQVQERTEELEATNEELLTTNEELFKLNDKLLASNEELSQYAYVASHDLQEPLRKIQVYSNMLIKQKSTPEEIRPVVNKIAQSAERMTLLIKDLLNFSRLAKTEESAAIVDLNDTLRDIINDFELLISEKKATLEVGKLPRVAGVALQMNQLFYNLISNSLKFTKQDVPPQIKINASELSKEQLNLYINKVVEGKTYYHITVKDNGIGFETKYADQIFEVFKRLHGKDVYPGSGIGLALCKRIVTNHGGHLYTESEQGRGTTFHVILHN